MPSDPTYVLEPAALDVLVGALKRRGFTVLGPTRRDGAILYEELDSAADLPIGWTDVQEAGSYRLERRDDEARFGYAVGPHSWKQFLFPPRVRLWRARRAADGAVAVEETPPEEGPYAFVGMRSCELHAMAIQDRVFIGGTYVDGDYAGRRKDAFVVAVNCFEPAATCFCTSMGTGPKAESGYDLALTEILDGEHRFLAQAGSERGAEILDELPRRPAERDGRHGRGEFGRGRRREDGQARRRPRHPRPTRRHARAPALGRRRRALPDLRQLHARVPDVLLLECRGRHRLGGRRIRSLPQLGHLLLRQCTRTSTAARSGLGRSRYRQWLTHKFGTWHDQFGSSGCVGCGRCIAWCPVGIDVTEELSALRTTEGAHPMETLEMLLQETPFFAPLARDQSALVAGCG